VPGRGSAQSLGVGVVLKSENLRPAGPAALRETEDPEAEQRVPAMTPDGHPSSVRPEPEDAALDLTVLATDPNPVSSGQPLAYRRHRSRRKWTLGQVGGRLLIAGACAAAAGWYVPRLKTTDRKMLTGPTRSPGRASLPVFGPAHC
jgi:hypothetical protein